MQAEITESPGLFLALLFPRVGCCFVVVIVVVVFCL